MRRVSKKDIFLTLIIVGAFVLILVYTNPSRNIPTNSTSYIVKSGDTLWGIASSHCPDSHTGAVVNEIQSRNNLGGTIYPGMVLEVPVESQVIADAKQR